MAEEQHNKWNDDHADRADDAANNVSDAHGVVSFVGGWWGPKPPVARLGKLLRHLLAVGRDHLGCDCLCLIL
jgi:hypothetical protein